MFVLDTVGAMQIARLPQNNVVCEDWCIRLYIVECLTFEVGTGKGVPALRSSI